MGTVELTFQYTKEEFVKAERQYLFASKIITKTSVVVLAFYLPFSVLYLFLSSFSAFSVVSLCVSLVVSVLGCLLYFYIPARRFDSTAKYQEAYHIVFSNDGIGFKTHSIDAQLAWNTYTELWESEAFYYLIQALRVYTLIPKRAFDNPCAMQAFEEIATLNLQRAKRTL